MNRSKWKTVKCCVVACGVWMAGEAWAVSEYYLEFPFGEIDGSSVAVYAEGQVSVLSYSFNGGAPVSLGPGGGEIGRFYMDGLTVFAQLDPKANVKLMEHLITGTSFQSVILHQYETSGLPPYEPQKITMTTVYLEEFQQEGADGDTAYVHFVLRPATIKIESEILNPDGSTSTGASFGWNFLLNEEL